MENTLKVGSRVRVLAYNDVWYGEVSRIDPNFQGDRTPGRAINIYVEGHPVDGEGRCFTAMCWLEGAGNWMRHNGLRWSPEVQIELAE